MHSLQAHSTEAVLAKMPQVTLLFWIVEIFATTLGETGGDAVSMSMNLGYLDATGIFAAPFGIWFAREKSLSMHHIDTTSAKAGIGWRYCSPLRSAPQRATAWPRRCSWDTLIRRYCLPQRSAWSRSHITDSNSER